MAPKKKDDGDGMNAAASAKAKMVSRQQSDIQALGKDNQAHKRFFVWTPKCPGVDDNPDICFGKCLVLPGSTKTTLKVKQTDPPGDNNVRTSECLSECQTERRCLTQVDAPSLA
eukprot:GHVU01067463.1.p1 GENE.GHVU01067463.1~~GHVU01067463.1.p1  ORF type:complete len:114 (+),score=22.32 GHVU01067463.1:787-1128(+)